MSRKKDKKMSVEATIWAWSLTKQQVSSLEKLILLSLADRANEKMECFPSAARLEKDCNTNIKTIYKSLENLCKKNIIQKTGQMKGRTKSVPVYRLLNIRVREDLSTPKNGLSKNKAHPKMGTLSLPKNGLQNLSLEPNKTTTTEHDSECPEKDMPKSVVVVNNYSSSPSDTQDEADKFLVASSQAVTKKLSEAFRLNPVETKNIKSEYDFLRACQYSIDHRNDGNIRELRTAEERVRGIIKLVNSGMFDEPKGWSKESICHKKEIEERARKQAEISLKKWQEEEAQRIKILKNNPIKQNPLSNLLQGIMGKSIKPS